MHIVGAAASPFLVRQREESRFQKLDLSYHLSVQQLQDIPLTEQSTMILQARQTEKDLRLWQRLSDFTHLKECSLGVPVCLLGSEFLKFKPVQKETHDRNQRVESRLSKMGLDCKDGIG